MIAVVGSGILGLAVAEVLSRSHPVVVISNENPLAGSQAAAANLAIKAQLFGRDTHFQLKLKARQKYRHWLQTLLSEIGKDEKVLNDFFCEGAGLEFFTSPLPCERQLERVRQPEVELARRGLGPQLLQRNNDTSICYLNEAWVDATRCLALLREVLQKRTVKFVNEEVQSCFETIEALKSRHQAKQIIFCTGAWTPELMSHFGFELQGSKRLSIGSTLIKQIDFNQIAKTVIQLSSASFPSQTPIALCELRSDDGKHKVVLSGNASHCIFSSSSDRISSLEGINRSKLQTENEKLDQTAFVYLKKMYPTSEVKTGMRIGFGHTELIVKRFSEDVIVCCGAHKSGFLFAPVVGELVSNTLKN